MQYCKQLKAPMYEFWSDPSDVEKATRTLHDEEVREVQTRSFKNWAIGVACLVGSFAAMIAAFRF